MITTVGLWMDLADMEVHLWFTTD